MRTNVGRQFEWLMSHQWFTSVTRRHTVSVRLRLNPAVQTDIYPADAILEQTIRPRAPCSISVLTDTTNRQLVKTDVLRACVHARASERVGGGVGRGTVVKHIERKQNASQNIATASDLLCTSAPRRGWR